MKKTVSFVLLTVLLLSSLTVFSGCSLANDGSENEVAGVCGIESFFYRDLNGVNYNYADKYDYFLIVLNSDKSARVIYKFADGEEVSSSTTYTLTFAADEPEKVSKIELASFPLASFVALADGVQISTGSAAVSFTLYPIREDIVYSDQSLRKNGASGSFVKVGTKYIFNKIYNRTTDKKIERAKTKQTNERTNRSDTSDTAAE